MDAQADGIHQHTRHTCPIRRPPCAASVAKQGAWRSDQKSLRAPDPQTLGLFRQHSQTFRTHSAWASLILLTAFLLMACSTAASLAMAWNTSKDAALGAPTRRA